MLAGHDICSPPPGEQEAAAASWSQAAAGNYRLAPGLHRDKLISSKNRELIKGVFVTMLELVKTPASCTNTCPCTPVFFYFTGK